MQVGVSLPRWSGCGSEIRELAEGAVGDRYGVSARTWQWCGGGEASEGCYHGVECFLLTDHYVDLSIGKWYDPMHIHATDALYLGVHRWVRFCPAL